MQKVDAELNSETPMQLTQDSEQAVAPTQPVAGAGAIVRMAYKKPKLHMYGAVHKITGGLAGSGTDAQGMYMDMTMSDHRTKQDIVRIGTHPDGFGLYLFRYKPAYEPGLACGQSCTAAGAGQADAGVRHFGVLAQEVQQFAPSAVEVDAHGLLRVNYAALGIQTVTAPNAAAA